MIAIKFKGWFQCRLATDPDPSDEKRGVSGYMRALPGEPDLDRIIRFHNPLVKRSHTPTAGVLIENVVENNISIVNHELIGSKFNLLDNPKFYGYNAIIEDDGFEPIVPVNIGIGNNDTECIKRKLSDDEPTYPFNEYKLKSVFGKGYEDLDGAIIFEASDIYYQSGIYDPVYFIKERIKRLKQDLKNTTEEIDKYNLETRISFLKTPSASRFFSARMHWNLVLQGKIYNSLNSLKIEREEPWSLNFWMGAWDPDAQNGFVSGTLRMPGVKSSEYV